MIFHPEEYKAAVEYWVNRDFPHISSEQHIQILQKGKEMLKFHLGHPFLHHCISLCVFIFIFVLDWAVLLIPGAYIQSWLIAGLLVGILHGIIMYSLEVFTLHEGAAHKLIVLRKGRISRLFSALANNISRITFAESDYYAKNHLSHHANFTTQKDDEFLNFIFAKRFFSVLIPYSLIFNFSDFKAHSGMKYTPSRLFSLLLSFLYHGTLALWMSRYYSWNMIIVTLVLVYPQVQFWLDRLRQYLEHNLMPLNVIDGARDLGTGFLGILIGGLPWGQPCHWTHHLYPGIPWYNQLRLHKFIKKILTEEQKEAFLIRPVIGFPQKISAIIRATYR